MREVIGHVSGGREDCGRGVMRSSHEKVCEIRGLYFILNVGCVRVKTVRLEGM